MSLSLQLETVARESGKRIAPDLLARMSAATEWLRAENIASRAVSVGDLAPDFALPDVRGRLVTLSSKFERGPVILTFYRGGWCPYCNLELRAYQRMLGDIHAAGASLVAVSPQRPDNSLSTAQKNDLEFDVLSDAAMKAAEAFGIDFALPADLVEVYQTLGIDLVQVNANGEWRLPVPATFVVGKDGVVALAHVEADYRKRLEPREALDLVLRLSR